MMFDASNSIAAKEAGEIPDGPPAAIQEPVRMDEPRAPKQKATPTPAKAAQEVSIPRLPTHVLISKKRDREEFTNTKGLKKALMRWEYEGEKFDVYMLLPKKISTKIEIEE